jgi:hypothetical protein
VLFGLNAPDGGPTPASVFQGLVLLAVFAGPAVASLLAPEYVLALGGAMFVTGAALMSGGNLLGPLMLMPGVLLLLAGLTVRPAREAPVWMRLIGNTAALVLAMYLAISPGVMTWLIALVIAAVVAVANSRVTRPQISMS